MSSNNPAGLFIGRREWKDPKKARAAARALVDAIFMGFDDVIDWWERKGPAPDVHRVLAFIRLPTAGGRIVPDPTYAGIVFDTIAGCVGNRLEERPELFVAGEEEPVAYAWMTNAALLYLLARRNLPLEVEQLDEMLYTLPVQEDCAPDCPARASPGKRSTR
jgi:hypothetical protein